MARVRLNERLSAPHRAALAALVSKPVYELVPVAGLREGGPEPFERALLPLVADPLLKNAAGPKPREHGGRVPFAAEDAALEAERVAESELLLEGLGRLLREDRHSEDHQGGQQRTHGLPPWEPAPTSARHSSPLFLRVSVSLW